MGNIDLEGKSAVVTGGSRGIGRAIAEALVEAGARVTISGTDPEKGARTIAEMNAGDAVVVLPCRRSQ